MGKIYKCTSCKEGFNKKSSLNQHQRGTCKQKLSNATVSMLFKRRDSARRRREKEKEKKHGIESQQLENTPMETTEDNNQTPAACLPSLTPFLPTHILTPPSYTLPETVELPLLRPSGRPNRHIRRPRRYEHYTDEFLPEPPPIIPNMIELPSPSSASTPDMENDICETPTVIYTTPPNSYGVFHTYQDGPPSYVPNHNNSSKFATKSDNQETRSVFSSLGLSETDVKKPFFAPLTNISTYRLMKWFYDSSTVKSSTELQRLVDDVILAEDFDQEELLSFRVAKENELLDNWVDSGPALNSSVPFSTGRNWKETAVKIPIPAEKITFRNKESIPQLEVPGLFYRRPIEVIKAALSEPLAQDFHLIPYQMHWTPDPNRPPERLYSEIYTADTLLNEHAKIKSQPPSNNCSLETVVLSLMFWSDSTHLTAFSDASLWPIYMFFGNLSKYARGKPSTHASHHIAYIPKLSDSFKDGYKAVHKKYPTQSILTNCRRELVHGIWLLLLDQDFVDAYKNGFTHQFFDGICRRVVLRISTYGMDYPEKILISLIRYFGNFPCPRCLIPKSMIRWLGTTPDEEYRTQKRRVDDSLRQKKVKKAWDLVYLKGNTITSKGVEELLGPTSLVPVQNAFSIRLSDAGFDFHDMIAPDFLHEFELGVWKRTFIHLIRLLASHGKGVVDKLNERYRNIPTYGNGVIQKFYNDASAMKKLAGRDYEDLLQCALPCFEGLLPPEHDSIVCKLIFELASWHSLAKLRLHSESTIKSLEGSTRRLGQLFRRFVTETCQVYETYELRAETVARGKRLLATNPRQNKSSAAKKVEFQLNTYKFHALGDYALYIRQFGTYDNFSTQIGEVEHKGVKKLFPRTQKKQYTKGIAKQHNRERLLHLMSQNDPRRYKTKEKELHMKDNERAENIPPPTSPYEHHQMSVDARNDNALNIRQWLLENEGDPAIKNFLPKLRRHLFMQLIGYASGRDEDEITDEESMSIKILNDHLYYHETLRVNYTTYDLQRSQDSINPKTHPDIMVLSPEEDDGTSKFHPYWYARIIKIFHANVYFQGSKSCSDVPAGRRIMKFLFVRWFSNETLHEHGWRSKHLPMVNFTPMNDPEPFGFVNPRHILRASHLLPAFKFGRTDRLLPSSLARQMKEGDKDWTFYYVNIFVDRDMMMRYRGGGVGHKSTRYATNKFLDDRDPFDDIDFYMEHEQDPNRLERSMGDSDPESQWEDEERDSEETGTERSDNDDGCNNYADL